MEQIELRTPLQKERAERNAKILEWFPVIRQENPDVSFHRIACAIAERVGCTDETVKNVIINAGLYTPTPRN